MKTFEPNSALAQTINECPQRQTEPSLAHSKGKPDVSSTRTNINVRFATPFVLRIQIRVVNNGDGRQYQMGVELVETVELAATSTFE